MNRAYIISFERNPFDDYTNFHNNLVNNNNVKNWWHYLLNTYIIITPLSPAELEALLLKYLPQNNKFLIFDISYKDYGGWLPQGAWEWIKANTR